MDMTWVTDRIALGGAIWSEGNMQEVARRGVTHIIDMQIEFDDTELARAYGIEVLWNGTDDDFLPKPAELFERGVNFARAALGDNGCKVYIHCAAGVHRAAMMTLALLGTMGWEMKEAMRVIQGRRPVVDFADVYVRSVESFLRQRELSRGEGEASLGPEAKASDSSKGRNTGER
jgi:protein-tyrosine phosphatase